MAALIRATEAEVWYLTPGANQAGNSSRQPIPSVRESCYVQRGMAVPRDMQGIVAGRVHNALYYCPMLNLNKFIKPEFAIFRVAEAVQRTHPA